MTINVFERFGIEHLSASNIKMWCDSMRVNWGRKYLLRQDTFTSAAMLRGRAVEAGWAAWLLDGDLAAAKERIDVKFTFELDAHGIADKTDERRNLAPMLGQCLDWGNPFGKLETEQIAIEHRFSDVPVPFVGYVDMAFADGDVDLKTTTKLPARGEATREHIRQVALYRAARDMRPHSLLYVTPTKHLAIPVTDEEVAWGLAALHGEALAIQEFLSHMPDAETAVRCLGGPYLPFPRNDDVGLEGFV